VLEQHLLMSAILTPSDRGSSLAVLSAVDFFLRRKSCQKLSNTHFAMKPSAKKLKPTSRAAVKMVSRDKDRQRLESGESPESIQRENSIFPARYFENHRILNFSTAVGK
jgi:hypothetical protein